MSTKTPSFVSTRNACKLCSPLGASLAFRGIEGCIPLLHGSQGCATYIRRYMISHYKEPMDVASSSFHESAAIFGGGDNLKAAIRNVTQQYQPGVIGIASTCLSETIGDDVSMILHDLVREPGHETLPHLVSVSTPSYQGTHAEGYYATIRSLVEAFAEAGPAGSHVNIINSMLSPADIRYLHTILSDFSLPGVVMPDYSETLDGGAWREYTNLPEGGTPIDRIRSMGSAQATIEFTPGLAAKARAGGFLEKTYGVPSICIPIPVGIEASDLWMQHLSLLSGTPVPDCHQRERERLIDSYTDAHKYVFGKRAILYGEEEWVVSLAAFLQEIGIVPVLCASGGKASRMKERIDTCGNEDIEVRPGIDFAEIEERAMELKPDLLIGNSKGMKIARQLNVPLVRVGFPIHDRIGGARIHHIGYRGTQELFDRIVNALLEHKQSTSPVGYFYL